jgi:hypothetical protein
MLPVWSPISVVDIEESACLKPKECMGPLADFSTHHAMHGFSIPLSSARALMPSQHAGSDVMQTTAEFLVGDVLYHFFS